MVIVMEIAQSVHLGIFALIVMMRLQWQKLIRLELLMPNYKAKRVITFPEAKIQCDIVSYLQSIKIYCVHIPNERKCSAQAMGRLVAMGLRKGAADLMIFYPNVWEHRFDVYHNMALGIGSPLFPLVTIGYIEVKAPEGKQSPWQVKWQNRCRAAGLYYDVAYSVDDVKEILDRMYDVTL